MILESLRHCVSRLSDQPIKSYLLANALSPESIGRVVAEISLFEVLQGEVNNLRSY